MCGFGDGYKFVHDVNVEPCATSNTNKGNDIIEDLLVKLLGR